MASIFTKIVRGEIPSHKILEDEKFLAFLDVNPLRAGHTLVIPKKEVDYFFDLPDDLLSEIMIFAREVARKIEAVIPCERIGVTVIGLEVPHTHVHLIPINSITDMNFAKPKINIPNDEMAALAEKIRNA